MHGDIYPLPNGDGVRVDYEVIHVTEHLDGRITLHVYDEDNIPTDITLPADRVAKTYAALGTTIARRKNQVAGRPRGSRPVPITVQRAAIEPGYEA